MRDSFNDFITCSDRPYRKGLSPWDRFETFLRQSWDLRTPWRPTRVSGSRFGPRGEGRSPEREKQNQVQPKKKKFRFNLKKNQVQPSLRKDSDWDKPRQKSWGSFRIGKGQQNVKTKIRFMIISISEKRLSKNIFLTFPKKLTIEN